jgi:hypothetical protein
MVQKGNEKNKISNSLFEVTASLYYSVHMVFSRLEWLIIWPIQFIAKSIGKKQEKNFKTYQKNVLSIHSGEGHPKADVFLTTILSFLFADALILLVFSAFSCSAFLFGFCFILGSIVGFILSFFVVRKNSRFTNAVLANRGMKWGKVILLFGVVTVLFIAEVIFGFYMFYQCLSSL